jgi:hypothetical protein
MCTGAASSSVVSRGQILKISFYGFISRFFKKESKYKKNLILLTYTTHLSFPNKWFQREEQWWLDDAVDLAGTATTMALP